MKLVVDANVLFSAFLRDGLTRKVWFDSRLQLYSPKFIAVEYAKYSDELAKRSGLGPSEARVVLASLLGRVGMVPEPQLKPYATAAAHLTPDERDEQYIACALAVNAELWSANARHLQQPRIKLWNTTQLAQKLGYL